jgi:hypothetical protein
MPSRAETAARIKAARWLASEETDSEGKPKPLPVKQLVEREPAKGNLTVNRVEAIERAAVKAKPMELEKIAEALRLPHAWFTAPLDQLARPDIALERADRLLSALRESPGLPALPGGFGTKHLEPPHDGERPEQSPTREEAGDGRGGAE